MCILPVESVVRMLARLRKIVALVAALHAQFFDPLNVYVRDWSGREAGGGVGLQRLPGVPTNDRRQDKRWT